MKSPQVQPLDLMKERPSQKRARFITTITEAAR
jgi:hypothetical protein